MSSFLEMSTQPMEQLKQIQIAQVEHAVILLGMRPQMKARRSRYGLPLWDRRSFELNNKAKCAGSLSLY